jgi:hypothetical protein
MPPCEPRISKQEQNKHQREHGQRGAIVGRNGIQQWHVQGQPRSRWWAAETSYEAPTADRGQKRPTEITEREVTQRGGKRQLDERGNLRHRKGSIRWVDETRRANHQVHNTRVEAEPAVPETSRVNNELKKRRRSTDGAAYMYTISATFAVVSGSVWKIAAD